jgi:hypothetical protein
MKISQMIEELQDVLRTEGDVEVTCTHSMKGDGDPFKDDAFETTADHLIMRRDEKFGKHVKVTL